MDAFDEARDMGENPLPLLPPVGADPKNLLCYVREIEEEIATLTESIDLLRERRIETMKYIEENEIDEDDHYLLKVVEHLPNQKVDIDRLKKERADLFKIIVAQQREELLLKAKEIPGTKISQKELERVAVHKAIFEAFLHRPGETTYTKVIVPK